MHPPTRTRPRWSPTIPVNNTPDVLNGNVNSVIQIGDKVYVGGVFTECPGARAARHRSRKPTSSRSAPAPGSSTRRSCRCSPAVASTRSCTPLTATSGSPASSARSTAWPRPRRSPRSTRPPARSITAFKSPEPQRPGQRHPVRQQHALHRRPVHRLQGQRRRPDRGARPEHRRQQGHRQLRLRQHLQRRRGRHPGDGRQPQRPADDGGRQLPQRRRARAGCRSPASTSTAAATATLSSWNTTRFSPASAANFDTYVRDVDYSPDSCVLRDRHDRRLHRRRDVRHDVRRGLALGVQRHRRRTRTRRGSTTPAATP